MNPIKQWSLLHSCQAHAQLVPSVLFSKEFE